MVDAKPGDWALITGTYDGIFGAEVAQIGAITAKLIKFRTSYFGGNLSSYVRQQPKDSLLALFGSERDARECKQALDGVRGERDRRVSAAREAAIEQARRVIAARATGGEAA